MPLTLFDYGPLGPEELLPFDGSAILHRRVLEPAEAESAFEDLMINVEWDQPILSMWGKQTPQPRLSAWLGGPETAYSYSGLTMTPKPWIPVAKRLMGRCEEVAGHTFNSVLVNLYRDGSDSVAWHSDDEVELGKDPVIASLGLGAERRFDMRHIESGETIRIVLPTGSVLVMGGESQQLWQHQVTKTRRTIGPRINLTFRTVVKPL